MMVKNYFMPLGEGVKDFVKTKKQWSEEEISKYNFPTPALRRPEPLTKSRYLFCFLLHNSFQHH